MKKILVALFAALCACLSPLPLQADYYAFDNAAGDWNWNNPVNWGLTNNAGYNVEPTAADTARNWKGTVTLALFPNFNV